MCLFSGFFMPVSKLDFFLQFLTFGSIVKLTLDSALIAIYGFDRCDSNQGFVTHLLDEIDLQEDMLWGRIGLLLIHLVVWRFLAFSLLLITANSANLQWLRQKLTYAFRFRQSK